MIVEIVSKAGRVMDVYAFDKNEISIGRGYQNDLILRDPYLDETHLEVSHSEGEVKIRDCESLNGTRVKKAKQAVSSAAFVSVQQGAIIQIGKTFLRIVDKGQALPSTLKTSRFEPVFAVMSTGWLSVILLVLYGAFTLYGAYAANPFSDKLAKELVNLVYAGVAAIVYGAFWVLIAKMQGLDGRFVFNVNLLLTLVCVDALYELLAPMVGFNLDWLLSMVYLGLGFSFVTVCLSVFFSCTQTLHASARRSLLFGGAAGFLLVASDLNDLVFPPDFSRAPSYDMTLTEPRFQLRDGVSLAEFLEQVEAMEQN